MVSTTSLSLACQRRRLPVSAHPIAMWRVAMFAVMISLHSCHVFSFNTQLLIKPRFSGIGLRDHSAPTKRYNRHLHNTKQAQFGNTILLGHDLGSSGDTVNDGGIISVTVQRTLSDATPYEARNAWIEYHWIKGGGLPIAILSEKLQADRGVDLERTILPIFMKEKAEYNDECLIDAKSIGLQYTVTDAGPFFSDLIPGSHSALVTFDATNNTESSGCLMKWKVTFSTTRWAPFYDSVTKQTVGIAASTIQEACSTPRLFSMTTKIDGSSHTIDPAIARKECLDFLFAEGGGLPLLPPIPFGDVLSEGGGSARRNLLRIPPLITESIIDTKTSDGMAEFTYRLNDPGWSTFPFLLHTHIGRVRFTSNAASDLVIDWDVEIRPFKFASSLVEKLAETTVSTVLRNLLERLTEPNAVVVVKPPGENTNVLATGQTRLGKVANDTWLGGVLSARLSDTRSTTEQMASLFQPWTWGRSGTGDESDCLQFQWTDGHRIPEP